MFQKRRTILNGVELPEEFSGSSIINNVAISRDGTKYASVSRDGGLVTGNMPEDGRLEVDGNVINYQKGTGRSGVNVRGSGFYMSSSGGSVVITSGGRHISVGGSDLEFEIDNNYEGVNRVSLKESENDVNLALSEDSKVYVKGLTSSEPVYTGDSLFVDGLEGTLSLPRSNQNLEVDVSTSAGDVDGDVAHKGRIRTSAGDISIELYAPLTVEANTSAGDVRVKKMISEGRGVYTPPNAKSLGTLVLETSAGDIKVNYMLK